MLMAKMKYAVFVSPVAATVRKRNREGGGVKSGHWKSNTAVSEPVQQTRNKKSPLDEAA